MFLFEQLPLVIVATGTTLRTEVVSKRSFKKHVVNDQALTLKLAT